MCNSSKHCIYILSHIIHHRQVSVFDGWFHLCHKFRPWFQCWYLEFTLSDFQEMDIDDILRAAETRDSDDHPHTIGEELLSQFKVNESYAINIFIKHFTHYLSSHWQRAYTCLKLYFWKWHNQSVGTVHDLQEQCQMVFPRMVCLLLFKTTGVE